MRRFVAALALAVLAAAPARAGTFTLTFPPASDGTPYIGQSTGLPDGEVWFVGVDPAGLGATNVGTASPSYAGSPGVTFAGDWSLGYVGKGTGAPMLIQIMSLSLVVAPDAASPSSVDITAAGNYDGATWDYSVTGAGTYTFTPTGSVVESAVTFGPTGDWQVTALAIDYVSQGVSGPLIPFVGGSSGGGGGGPGGSAPEPGTGVMGCLALLSLSVWGRWRRR